MDLDIMVRVMSITLGGEFSYKQHAAGFSIIEDGRVVFSGSPHDLEEYFQKRMKEYKNE
jgi:hypothetical protein